MRPLRPPSTTAENAADPGADARLVSFEELYAGHLPFVWRCLRALGVRESALEDATQEVFLAVHRRLPEFQGQSTPRTWLFGIVRRVASNQRRGASRQREHLRQIEAESVAPGVSPLEQVQNTEAAAFVQQFVDGLPQGPREVFVLAVIEEMSIPMVAEALSIRLNTAYTWLRRVRARFRDAMAERARAGSEP